MTKLQYYLHTLKNTFNVFSRASFDEIISFFYINVLFGLFWTLTYIFFEILDIQVLKNLFRYANNFLIILSAIFLVSLMIRRLHDFGKSSIYLFVPFYNLFLLFQEGDKTTNKYGEVPV